MTPVGIIGGMGPHAGAQYLGVFLDECVRLLGRAGARVSDQGFPPHYVLQQPVPDRTQALLGSRRDYAAVLAALRRQMAALRGLGATAVAMACNTAHAWHADLQQLDGSIELIHIGDVAAQHLGTAGEADVCVLCTAGTVRSGIYARSFARAGIRCHEPDARELQTLMAGIYDGVKAGDLALGRRCFSDAVARMAHRTGVGSFLMACTEIPLALATPDVDPACRLYDPTRLSARALAQRAFHSPRPV